MYMDLWFAFLVDKGWRTVSGCTPAGEISVIFTTNGRIRPMIFLEFAWANSRDHLLVWCPCTKCDNKRRFSKEDMGRHLLYNRFTTDYTVWIYHGEAHRMREEVVRPCLEACDDDEGVVDMLEDAHQALFNDTRDQEVMEEEEAKLFYKMMDSTKIPLHDNNIVSQLDAIGRLLGVKSELNISRLAPCVRNPLSSEDGAQGRPSHRVEDFGEVQLEGDDNNSSFVARLHNLGGVEEVFGDAPTLHEARLVPVDEQRDQRLETQAHAFGAELGNAILEGDRAVVLGRDGPLFLGQEDEVGLVDASEVGQAGLEILEKL
jgi:hypothetical protein